MLSALQYSFHLLLVTSAHFTEKLDCKWKAKGWWLPLSRFPSHTISQSFFLITGAFGLLNRDLELKLCRTWLSNLLLFNRGQTNKHPLPTHPNWDTHDIHLFPGIPLPSSLPCSKWVWEGRRSGNNAYRDRIYQDGRHTAQGALWRWRPSSTRHLQLTGDGGEGQKSFTAFRAPLSTHNACVNNQ